MAGAAVALAWSAAAAGTAWSQTAPAGTGSVTRLDTVTTTATKTEKLAIDVLGSVSTVDEAEIQTVMPGSLQDVLRYVPNVEVDGGPRRMAQQLNIRGLGGQRVVLRVDGARNNFQSGHRGRLFVDPDMLKQVEIVRGPTNLYGSGALGGVVAMETKDAFDYLGPGEEVGLRGKFGYQNVNEEFMESLAGFGAYQDRYSILVAGTRRVSSNVKTGNVEYDNAETRSEIEFSKDDLVDSLVKLTAEPVDGHKFSLTAGNYYNEGIIPTAADTDVTATSNVAARVTTESRYILGYNYAPKDPRWFDLTAKVYRNETDANEPVETGPARGRIDTSNLTTHGLDLYNTSRLPIEKLGTAAFTYGIEYYKDEQTGRRNRAPRDEFPDADLSVFGLYGQAEFELQEWLTVSPGFRYDSASLEPKPANLLAREEDRTTGNISFGVKPFQGLQLYGKYAQAFRFPSLTELYASGVHFTTGAFVNRFVPNPNLRAEDGETYEAGFSIAYDEVAVSNDRLRGKMSFFETHVEDFIDLQVVHRPPFDPFTSQSVNVAQAELRGFEGELTYDTAWVFAGVAYSQIRGMDKTQGDSLSSIPQDKTVLRLGTHIPPIDVSIESRATFLADQNRIAVGGTQTSGSAVYDIFASWVPQDFLQGLRLDAGVENVTDKNYRRHLNLQPSPGRNLKAAISYAISFDTD